MQNAHPAARIVATCRGIVPILLALLWLLNPGMAVASAEKVTVDEWSHTTSAQTFVGPVTTIEIRYNALRFGTPSTTVAIVPKDPPDFPLVIAALPGVPLLTQSNFLNSIIDASARSTSRRPHDACDTASLTAKSSFSAFLDASLDAAQCFNRFSKPFDMESKALRLALDIQKKVALWGDGYLAAAGASEDDQHIDVLVDCAHLLASHNGASAATAAACPYPGFPTGGIKIFASANVASTDLAALARDIAAYRNAVDRAYGAGKLPSGQRDLLAARFAGIPVGAYVADGPAIAAYASNYDTMQTALQRLSGISRASFVYSDSQSGTCSRKENGESRPVTVELRDRFAQPDAAPVKKDVAVIDCLGRNAVSAGAGYTGLHATTYQLQQRFASSTTTSQIARSNDNAQVAAAVLAHRCLCGHPTGRADGFVSAGVLSAGKSPIGLFGGISVRFGQRYFLSAGGSYGTEATVLNGTVGQSVPNDFKVSTGSALRLRPAILISIGGK
ncbi:MAG: hypothetical protein QOJ39_285 [Candidatus Eremiobacteraeota bacterium]|nr:hypothetical protein [Candidatus Eremiobacteraeota bacterium]